MAGTLIVFYDSEDTLIFLDTTRPPEFWLRLDGVFLGEGPTNSFQIELSELFWPGGSISPPDGCVELKQPSLLTDVPSPLLIVRCGQLP